jgi:hypothetical protein
VISVDGFLAVSACSNDAVSTRPLTPAKLPGSAAGRHLEASPRTPGDFAGATRRHGFLASTPSRPADPKEKIMIDRKVLRPSATLLVSGLITYVGVTFLHTGGPANDHKVIFGDYAGSDDWTAVHLGQFIGMALIVGGLLALSTGIRLRSGAEAWVARLGAATAGIALGLYGVLQAVDGVALKQAVDSWASAPGADKAARFASAETVRWLEWGTRSYQSYTLGLAFILLGSAAALSATLPRALGGLMVLSGLAYLTQGWVVGSEGFAPANTSAILAGYALMLAWTTWLAVIAWRPRGSENRAGALTHAVPTLEHPVSR